MTDVTFRPARAPRTSWCWWCRRAVLVDDIDAHRVLFDGSEEWVCGRCWERADPPVPLDMTEDDDAAH